MRRSVTTGRSRRALARIDRLRRNSMRGGTLATENIPAEYRGIGNYRRAVFWWRRLATSDDGDACLDLAYSLEHGLGVTRDRHRALQMYRKALAARRISQAGREEALYHRALCLLTGRSSAAVVRQAVIDLRRAAADGDFPQAAKALKSIRSGLPAATLCRCRRSLAPSWGGRDGCRVHRPASGRHNPSLERTRA
jgi:TPR repeat protein